MYFKITTNVTRLIFFELIKALKTTEEAKRPVYISIGHRIGLETAIWAVMQCIHRYRIPEPTRQADIRSRQLIRKLEESTNKKVDQYPLKMSFH